MNGLVLTNYVRLFRSVARLSSRRTCTARGSGLIIDTPGNFASAPGDDKRLLVKTCVQTFQGKPFRSVSALFPNCTLVNVIIVIGNERLSVEMQKPFDGSYAHKIQITKIPKSGI